MQRGLTVTGTTPAYHRRLSDEISPPRRDFREVRVARLQASTMVDRERQVAGYVPGETHHAAAGRPHRSTRRYGEVDPPMPRVPPGGGKTLLDRSRDRSGQTNASCPAGRGDH